MMYMYIIHIYASYPWWWMNGFSIRMFAGKQNAGEIYKVKQKNSCIMRNVNYFGRFNLIWTKILFILTLLFIINFSIRT